MINKFKNWLKKFKKNKLDQSDSFDTPTELYADEHDIDLDAQIPDEKDIEIVLADESPDAPNDEPHEEETKIPQHEDLEYPDTPEAQMPTATEDATGEITVMTSNSEDHTPSAGTGDIQEFDLSKNLSIKDKANIFTQNLKDKFQRIDFRKFKDFKFPKFNTTQGEGEPSLTQQLSAKYNIKIPKPVEELEKRIKKIPWQNLHNEVFYTKNRTIINKFFLLLLLVLIPYHVGKSLGLLIKGKPDYKNLNNNVTLRIDRDNELTSAQLIEIKNAKLFKTDKVETNNHQLPTNTGPAICKTATKKSNLPIKLVNTIVLQDSVKSIASVQIRSKTFSDVREGDKIDDIAKVDKIDRLGIIVKNLKDGTCESIDNVEMSGYKQSPIAVMSKQASKTFVANKKIAGIENEGNTFKIQKSFLQEKMKNISDILTQARGIQIPNPDGSMSFKIVDVEPGGIFAYLGIQDNDIITHIGGKKINDLNEVMSLFGKISNLDQLNITISRGGEEVPLEYKLQ